ncbi:ArsA family ATPase [Pseudobacteroides cellulosolvens]|uniref:arsenite-transporting ATPase n=1 Tax=Pseudobacteroides cellulosolvens ATCC 35603 = DSM 2933 TaxID=398512 RepID=A0A0L6JW34_9FIRM|nr:ArsA family ATPase [Pseudobacteroides cellulosolvens]KNY29820.1 arsenite-activated ATPase ArsA [Pseudobacteroides cellulosolvens ATCC 35603 = DSM 2933]
MRIIVYTGKGGVGKTSIAAATALKSARRGLKTLIISTDAAHSLGDSMDIELGSEPVNIEENLWAQEIDTIHEIEKGWGKVQEYLTTLFTSKTVKDITTEELTVFPGMDELLSLIRILEHYKEGFYDLIVIDCAPTGETLALLSYPDLFRWWMEKLFPLKRKAINLTRPVIEPLLGIPMPSDGVMGEIEKIFNQLDEMKKIFTDRKSTSIRIVVNPEKMVIKEAKRSFTYLNIYNFNVDAIVVNRVIPKDITDNYFALWKEIQSNYIDEAKECFSPIPILYAPLFEKEIVGLNMLERLGEVVFTELNPEGILYNIKTQSIEKIGKNYLLKINMPFCEKNDLSLAQKADELIIRAGRIKRNITLPKTLQYLSITSAKFEQDTLNIIFGGE